MSYCHHNPFSLFCNSEEKDDLFIVLLIFLANKNGIVCQAVNIKKKKNTSGNNCLSVSLGIKDGEALMYYKFKL